MKVRTVLGAALAATIVATATPLLAASAADTTKPTPQQLDTNGDGQISRDEAQHAPRLAASFDRLDADKDGQLSREELRAARMKRGAAHRAQLDVDKDGQISRDEAKPAQRLSQNFDAIDANKDGQLTRDELSAWRKANPPQPRPAQPVQPPVKP